ncbi:hypothetical protein AB1285_20840 [Microbacterium sp. NRRL B-14842]|uniref:hypothetical protein n=1 Tax=Microbacterium sp. NRRL B-14842 TaxID=3162881 RepID=UPI0035112A00
MQSTIKVVCRGTKRHGSHPSRIVAQYRWSESDDVWERVDRYGEDHHWFIQAETDGTLVGYPTPHFKCACGRDEQPRHEDLQNRLTRAQAAGELAL